MNNMYYQGTGKAAHGFRISVILDESRFLLGYAIGTYRNIPKIETAAVVNANDTLNKYYMPEIKSCGKSRMVSSFFSSLMCECLYREEYSTADELNAILENYVQWYNYERLHSALDYRRPFEVWEEKIKLIGNEIV